MSDSTSLVNIGDLAKPATTLIEKISDATGALLQPWQMKRIAKAEVEANKIKALGELDISDIQKRAMNRLLAEETIKQENIENITEKALLEVKEDAKPEEIENDWLANFFDKCKLVSDEEMQSIWANLLAGEANKPGRFSKRTIELVSTLDKSDAELFTSLCEFCVSKTTPLIFDHQDPLFSSRGLNFKSFNDLDSLGLIKFNTLGYLLNGAAGIFTFQYFDSTIKITVPETARDLRLGKVMLTKSGLELALICNPKKNDEFLEYVRKNYEATGFPTEISITLIGNDFSFSLSIADQSATDEIEKIKTKIQAIFETNEIKTKRVGNNRYSFNVFLSKPINEWDLSAKIDTFNNSTSYNIQGYGFL